jgi:spore coat polysaccharide biosynthesis protein SpsF
VVTPKPPVAPQSVVALVQARMGSSRLPGKVLRQVAGRTLLAHLIERLRAAHSLDALVVATTVDPSDDAIEAECHRRGVRVFRGSELDVLARFDQAAGDAATVVRVTGDCPLMDPAEVDRVVTAFQAADVDYATNQLPAQRKVPLGLAVEVFSRAALRRAALEAHEPHQREHVTPYLYDTPGRFRVLLVDYPRDLSRWRITVDTPADLAVVQPTLEALDGRPDAFSLQAALDFLEAHPDIAARNADVAQKSFREAQATETKKINPSSELVVFRADASATGGTGHVMRTLAIAEAWRARGGRALLVSHRLAPTLAERVRDHGIELLALEADVLVASAGDAEATRACCQQHGARVVLVDGYGFTPAWLASLRSADLRVAYVDDFGLPELELDAVLMPNAGAEPPPRHKTSRVLHGSAFTPVRAEFHEAARPVRDFARQPRHLLLTFGGSDPAGMTLRAARALAGVDVRVTALLGALHPEIEAVRALPHVEVRHDVRDMPALLAEIDLACTAGGTTCWELATMGVPMLIVQVADNQAVVAQGIVAAGAGRALAPAGGRQGEIWPLSDAALQAGLRAFLATSAADLRAMSNAGRRLIDGCGAGRIAEALAALAAGD